MGDSPDIFGDDDHAFGGDGFDDGFGGDGGAPSAAELEAAGQSALFGGGEVAPVKAAPVAPVPAGGVPYRVLARKYRPQTFSQLIGQDAMVQTLANAIKRERLAHAFLMTGVRGVGKTSTARLIAKALNCIGPDGKGGPTIDPCGVCEPCVAIAEGRHIDVIEMDAASHTGVDDVREIIEAVRYSAVSARYKIYIIDEVHMLSRNAFNALLKTLEEPPAHVKFLFATTEVEKLPVTVLSRCQRFDLRRIPAPLLKEHFAGICVAEGVEAEDEALAMVAEAAEGSVRDGLSILDQAIAHADLDGHMRVSAAQVRDMLGLTDKSTGRRLFAALLEGDGAGLLELIAGQFAAGVEPIALIRGAMALTHRITVCQIGRDDAGAVSVEERAAVSDWAARLKMGQLHRLWQLLLKGHEEVKAAPDPLVAAEMALLRCLHAADLPDPGALVKRLEEMAANGALVAPAVAGPDAGAGGSAVAVAPEVDWAALVHRVEHSHLDNRLSFGMMLRCQVRVIELVRGQAGGRLVYEQAPGFPDDIAADLKSGLQKALDGYWEVERRPEGGAPTLIEAEQGKKAEAEKAVLASPLVAAALAAFPGAEIVEEEDGRAAGAAGGGRRDGSRGGFRG
jgi:DNA polymerase-3 subunit gamma/tau